VALIPHTIEMTTLKGLEPGDPVNLEADIIGKYVYRYLHPEEAGAVEGQDSSDRLLGKLEEGGFI
jgi:riboflavin synthase